MIPLFLPTTVMLADLDVIATPIIPHLLNRQRFRRTFLALAAYLARRMEQR